MDLCGGHRGIEVLRPDLVRRNAFGREQLLHGRHHRCRTADAEDRVARMRDVLPDHVRVDMSTPPRLRCRRFAHRHRDTDLGMALRDHLQFGVERGGLRIARGVEQDDRPRRI